VYADNARHIDDGACAFADHVSCHGAGYKERRGKVNVKHLLPLFKGHPERKIVLCDTGVVDKYVKSIGFFYGTFNRAVDCRGL